MKMIALVLVSTLLLAYLSVTIGDEVNTVMDETIRYISDSMVE